MTTMRWGVVGVVAALGCLISCSGTIPAATCVANEDCGPGLLCKDGRCEANAEPECADEETRPCGPAPVGACKQGTQRCVGGVFETTCTGQVRPTDETCNGVDDDCDGTVDEGVGQTWYADRDDDGHGAAAESEVACAAPAGTVTSSDDCDDTNKDVHPGAAESCASVGVDDDCDGTADEGCGCSTVGMTMACCSGRGTQTCEARDGGSAYSTCSAAVSAESCNGLDDDCDGQADEGLSFVRDGGFTLADGGAVAADGTCASGVGACRRTASAACTMGAVACAVTEGTPATETCNGIDDDCDGQIDNGAQVTCYPDEDGDGVATSATASQQCADASRPTFGNCPTGFVGTAPTAVDCAPMDPASYRVEAIRDDGDGDTYCTGAPTDACIGASAPTGKIIASTCAATTDCDDASANVYRLASVRTDSDGDTYCTGATRDECVGAALPAGLRAPSACPASDDCNDASATAYQLASTRTDADNDSFCVGTATSECIGASPPAGRRLATSCGSGDDCNDASATKYRTAVTRKDADGDGHCVDLQATECIGVDPPPGRRLNSACLANDDCDDMNGVINLWVNVRNDADSDGFCVGVGYPRCSETVIPVSAGVRPVTTCNATDDCNDSNGVLNTIKSVRADADFDGFCAGAAFNRCSETIIGTTTGVRLATACNSISDCNDNNASLYRGVSLRTDSDNDAFCIGLPVVSCLGATNPSGMREVSSCQGDDCRDSNPWATSVCSFNYTTLSATKQCGTAPVTETFSVGSQACGQGFVATSHAAVINTTLGTCTSLDAQTVRMTCGFAAVGSFQCATTGVCSAQ